jgi:hypothetical protein
MATGTFFNPTNIQAFEKSKLNKNAKGVIGTALNGTSTTLDLTMTDDCIIAGGHTFLAKGAAWGDSVDFQVVHPINGVLAQFINSWYVNPDSTEQSIPPSNYPAKIVAGLILRVVYHSVGATDVGIVINYNLENVLE